MTSRPRQPAGWCGRDVADRRRYYPDAILLGRRLHGSPDRGVVRM